MNFSNQIYYWAHMLDEAMCDKTFILEDREGKNINKAEKWIKTNHPEVIGRKLENGVIITPRVLTQEIRNTMPNVRLADCKFLVGITRLYFDNQTNPEIQSVFSTLNKMLKIICSDAHVDEYDNDLNGMSFDDLDRRFSGAVQKDLDNDRDEIDKLVLLKKSDYDIIAINSFKQSKTYGKYTSWCVTHDEDMFRSYTKNGLGRFYFCLKPGFQKIRTKVGEGCPMDDYGKSMIAISVNDDGSLNTCTCRWNHDNGGNDNMMDTKQISEFFGVNFYKTFKPYDADELMDKYRSMQIADDDISIKLGMIKCEDPELNDVFYVKVDNGKIKRYNGCKLAGHVIIDNKLMHIENDEFVEGISDSITSIDDFAFYGCTNLTSITIPDSITSIGALAFRDCTNLSSIVIPDSVTVIGNGAFFNCNKLASITIPDSVRSIGTDAFSYTVIYNNTTDVLYIGNHLIKCKDKSITSYDIKPGTKIIAEAAFFNCTSLTSITIPDSVTSIGSSAFNGCSNLNSIKIPDSVIRIGYNTFSYCSKLTSVIFENSDFEQIENYPWGIKDKSIFKVKQS